MPDPDTRARLLDAAWAIGEETGVAGLTLAEVGARAGVSRQAVYLHFGNRPSLLVEMTRRFDRTSGFTRRLAASRDLPPVAGFRRMLEEWFDYLPAILPTARALEAAAATSGDGATAYFDRMADWRDGIRIAVARLADEDRLATRWNVDTATDWVWAAVHPSTYQHLVAECGWKPAEAAATTVAALERELFER